MAITYNWSLGHISAKKAFTDKNGNFRENVIKSVELIFTGVHKYIQEIDGEEQEKETIQSKGIVVDFNIIDLSSFQDYTELNKEIVFNWAFSRLTDREKLSTENAVKMMLNDYKSESNLIKIEIND